MSTRRSVRQQEKIKFLKFADNDFTIAEEDNLRRICSDLGGCVIVCQSSSLKIIPTHIITKNGYQSSFRKYPISSRIVKEDWIFSSGRAKSWVPIERFLVSKVVLASRKRKNESFLSDNDKEEQSSFIQNYEKEDFNQTHMNVTNDFSNDDERNELIMKKLEKSQPLPEHDQTSNSPNHCNNVNDSLTPKKDVYALLHPLRHIGVFKVSEIVEFYQDQFIAQVSSDFRHQYTPETIRETLRSFYDIGLLSDEDFLNSTINC